MLASGCGSGLRRAAAVGRFLLGSAALLLVLRAQGQFAGAADDANAKRLLLFPPIPLFPWVSSKRGVARAGRNRTCATGNGNGNRLTWRGRPSGSDWYVKATSKQIDSRVSSRAGLGAVDDDRQEDNSECRLAEAVRFFYAVRSLARPRGCSPFFLSATTPLMYHRRRLFSSKDGCCC